MKLFKIAEWWEIQKEKVAHSLRLFNKDSFPPYHSYFWNQVKLSKLHDNLLFILTTYINIFLCWQRTAVLWWAWTSSWTTESAISNTLASHCWQRTVSKTSKVVNQAWIWLFRETEIGATYINIYLKECILIKSCGVSKIEKQLLKNGKCWSNATEY